MTFRRQAVVALGAALASGCYLSHARGSDAGPEPVDVGVDAPAPRPCDDDDIQIDSTFWNGNVHDLTTGTLRVVDAAGREIVNQGAGDDSRVEACLRREEGPFSVGFRTGAGDVYFNGLDADFRQDVWGAAGATTRRNVPVDDVRFDAPAGHRFVVHIAADLIRTFTSSPSLFACWWPTTNVPMRGGCPLRYVEEDATGRLVGGGETNFRTRLDDDAVLSTTTRAMAPVSFEVELPSEGLLDGVPLYQVRPLACDERITGVFVPGQPTFMRCRISGAIRTLEAEADGVVRGQVDALTEGPFETDAMMAILDDGDVQAVAIEPCCSEGPVRFRFPLARSITIEGETFGDFRFSVDAPGYEYAYGFRAGDVVYDLEADGVIDDGFIAPAVSSSPDTPLRSTWAGAVTIEGTVPWLAPTTLPAPGTHRVVMVRRRYRTPSFPEHTWD